MLAGNSACTVNPAGCCMLFVLDSIFVHVQRIHAKRSQDEESRLQSKRITYLSIHLYSLPWIILVSISTRLGYDTLDPIII